jgi:hypothetical protein
MSLDTGRTVDEFDAIWRRLDPYGNRPTQPGRHLPRQVGPFAWNPVTSDGRAPVGGWAKLTRQENGTVHFTGHFYVPGSPRDVTACVSSVRVGDQTVYTSVHHDVSPAETTAGEPPTLWWQVSVLSTDADLAGDVTAACRRALGSSTAT